jgi:hypothetical protein
MLDTIGDLISGLVELVARGVFAIARSLFRWEASAERPGWVRFVAIALILIVCAVLFSVLFSFFVMAFYVLLAIAAIGAVIAFFAGS